MADDELDILSDADKAENLNTIRGPLMALYNLLDGEDGDIVTAAEVRAALKSLQDAHEDCIAGAVPDNEEDEPWPEYTGTQFGLGDQFDRSLDKIQGIVVDQFTDANIMQKRPILLAKVKVPVDILREHDNQDAEMDMGAAPDNGGRRKRRRGKKTKSKSKKVKKTRRYTRRR